MRAMKAALAVALTCALVLVTLAGCGGAKSIAKGSPEGTAEAFVEAMKAGDYDVVAAGYDYETYARRENPDWDSLAPKARSLIIEKLAGDQVAKISALSGLMSGDVSVGDPTTEGDRAIVPLTAGSITLHMRLLQVDGVWKIASVSEQARTRGGQR